MCGFTGIVDFENNVQEHKSFMEFALNDLRRRGPDTQDTWISQQNHVLLGFARLAIRDLSPAGNQPMASQRGEYVIVYNGETYNTDELILWANIDASSLNGNSDTEVILRCIEVKGVKETIEKMDGIFAIGLLHIPSDVLYLIRDHAGVKPLYFGINSKGVVFSSTYQHVTAHPFFRQESIDENALANYFKYGFIQANEGLLHHTFFVPHGHIIHINLKSGKYESIPYDIADSKNPNKSPQSLQQLYSDIVSSQLISDVPIGTFLSGGVDSSLTTGLASNKVQHITAYTIGVNDPELDETQEASRFASYFNVNHLVHRISEDDVLNMMDQYDDSMGEPLADFSSLLTLKVCEIAKQSLTVALSGDGGDELFWGYNRFVHAANNHHYLQQPKPIRLFSIAKARFGGKPIPFKLLRYHNFGDYYLDAQGLTGNTTWLNQVLHIRHTPSAPYFALTNPFQCNTKDEAMQYAKRIEYDIHMQRVLLKVDRAGMYHSLEVRTPLLSKKLVAQSLVYDFNECNNGKQGKLPLRAMLKTIIPPTAADSGTKKGFSPPLATWLRTTLKNRFEKRLHTPPSAIEQYMNKEGILKLWQNHQTGKEDNSWPLWAIYSLYVWVDTKMYSNAKDNRNH